MSENPLAMISTTLKESVAKLSALVNEAIEKLENENLGQDTFQDSEAFLSGYTAQLVAIIDLGAKLGLDDLVQSCNTVTKITNYLLFDKAHSSEQYLLDLFEYSSLLESQGQQGWKEVKKLDEFIIKTGWRATVTAWDDEKHNEKSLPAESIELEDDVFAEEDFSAGDNLSAVFDALNTTDDSEVSLELTEGLLEGNGLKLDKLQQEVVDLLRNELSEVIETRQHNLAGLIHSEPGVRKEQLEMQSAQIDRIASATEMVGLEGLSLITAQISANIAEMDVTHQALEEKYHPFILEWPVYVLRYFQESFSHKSAELLIQLLQRDDWPFPLSEEEGKNILQQLYDATVNLDDPDARPRQTVALIEDLSLTIPTDVNRELLDSLLEELPDHTAEFSASVQSMISNHFISDIDLARRVAHTIKGACNTVGIVGIANMTHQLEDILDELALNNVVPKGELANAFLDAADCLESMVEAVLGLAAPPAEALQVQQSLLDWANHIDQKGINEVTIKAATAKAPKHIPAADTIVIANAPPESPSDLSFDPAADPVIRIRSSLVDEILRLAGENSISTGQIRSHLSIAQESAIKLNTHNQYITTLVNELEQLVDVRGITSRQQQSSQQRSSDSGMDDLEMERYNELHTSTHRLIEAAVDGLEFTNTVVRDLKALEDVTEEQEQLVRENQQSVLKTRMVAVSTSIPRLQRCVRQTMRATGKSVRLEVEGSETLMDSTVLNEMMEPLMHILRNAVDHGIESEEQRTKNNKHQQGCINLTFAREGDHISVIVKDDGRGIDKTAIVAHATEQGLLDQRQLGSDEDIYNLILIHGFSTRNEITQMSGRGVGMDVVNEKVRSMKGTLTIVSGEGQGTSISILLPVTLLSTHAMLLPVKEQLFAISNFGVEEIIYINPGDIGYRSDKLVLTTGNDVINAHYLNEKLGVSQNSEAANDAHAGLLIRSTDGTRNVILVERVIDSRDLVIKPMGGNIPTVDGIVGATILGDGSIAPVLDLTELLMTASRRNSWHSTDALYSTERTMEHSTPSLPKAIVVDDSYSARHTLEQLVSDLGFQVRTAKDGMEAVEMIAQESPDILLTDLEMPRMNGLDLATHVRSNEKTRNVPIILITSRSTRKHRDLATAAGVNEYMTKPYSEDELTLHIETLLAS